MLDKDNIISTSVLEAIEKIPIAEKDYRKCSYTCFTLTVTAYKEQTNIIANMEIVVYLLVWIQCS